VRSPLLIKRQTYALEEIKTNNYEKFSSNVALLLAFILIIGIQIEIYLKEKATQKIILEMQEKIDRHEKLILELKMELTQKNNKMH